MGNIKIINYGSLNIDHVYKVKNFVKPGETIQSYEYSKVAGGKGLNQSIALAKAKTNILHAGKIGQEGLFLKEILEKENVDCKFVEVSDSHSSGHAIIQVDMNGQNSIVLYGGTNQLISEENINHVFADAQQGDFLVLQNEINMLDKIIETASTKGMKIFFNIAPMTDAAKKLPIHLVDTIVLNETEAAELSGMDSENYNELIATLSNSYPKSNILLTLGSRGAAYYNATDKSTVYVPADKSAKVVDTTAAGDTFLGYFIAMISEDKSAKYALDIATQAATITISSFGAAQSIPYRDDLIIQ